MDAPLIAEIERRAYRAWLPAEAERVQGWTLHASDGFSRRLNSAAPSSDPEDLDDRLRTASAWYAGRGLPLLIRMTPLVEKLDPLLEARELTFEGPTDVMVVDVGKASTDSDVEVDEQPDAEWLEVQRGLQGVPDDMVAAWKATLSRIDREAAFGLVRTGSRPIAAGIAVRDEGWVGLFEINVAAALRRRGVGRKLSRGLAAWGAAGGARRAYLQVLADNHPAQALYHSLGFRRAYRYWYRRAPQTGF